MHVAGEPWATERQDSQITAFSGVHFTETTWRLRFPVCAACLVRIRKRNRMALGLMLVPWLFVCSGWAVGVRVGGIDALMQVALFGVVACLIAGIGLFVASNRWKRVLKVVYRGGREVVFRSTRREYAEAFAKEKGVEVEKRLFYVRAS